MNFNPLIPFNLASLPNNIGSINNKDYTNLLIKARSELGELKGYSFSMPNPLLLLSPAIIKESLASSEIENINTTMINVLENQLFPVSEQAKPDKEVLKYRDAIINGYKELKDHALSTRTILSVYKNLVSSSNDEYRRTQNGIVNTATKKIIYTPPIASQISNYMGNLENYLNNQIRHDIDPLIKCAITHYQFEAIHPFEDGNGRTGRILMVLYLINAKIINLPTFYISGYINRNRHDYYRLLLDVTVNKNWKEYINFMLNGFYLQAKETKDILFKIMTLFFKFKDELKTKHKKIYSADLVEALFSYPVITPARLAIEMSEHYTTASRHLIYLEKQKILESKKIGKYHFYANTKLLQILRR